MAISHQVRELRDSALTATQLKIIQFCAEECCRQESGEISVFNMVKAYNAVLSLGYPETGKMFRIYPLDIEGLASMIEPIKNRNGFRRIPVTIRDGVVQPPNAELVPRLVEHLVESTDTLSPEEFYREFETVHPFVDGNGRVGAILYNWLRDSLLDPIAPPNFWKQWI